MRHPNGFGRRNDTPAEQRARLKEIEANELRSRVDRRVEKVSQKVDQLNEVKSTPYLTRWK